MGEHQLQYEVSDMSCGHCKAAVTSGVEAVAGVDSVDVDLETKYVTVTGPDLVEQVIADAILVAGYSPRLVG